MATTTARHRRPIELAWRVEVPLDAAVAIVGTDPLQVIGFHLGAPWAAPDIPADLGVGLPGGRRLARQVRVRSGPLLEDGDALALPLWWQDAEHPHLFPTFDGGLELRGGPDATELRLVGSYQPPLGAFGRFADGLLGHRLVMSSLEGFLGGAGERLAAAAAAAA